MWLRVVSVLLLLAVSAGVCLAGEFPREPEFDNPEYLLDLMSNRYSRLWREVWDGGDNRFHLRLGSNNVGQWFIEEELKFSANLIDKRLRFRLHHAHLNRNSSEQLSISFLEFELRVLRDNYFSFYIRPTFVKTQAVVGLAFQNRRAVNRYTMIFVDFPGWHRNFTQVREATKDSLLTVHSEKPMRFGIDMRERIGGNVWLRFVGEVAPAYQLDYEDRLTAVRVLRERGRNAAAGGWIEYVWNEDDVLELQSALGVETTYRRAEVTTNAEFASFPSLVAPDKRDGFGQLDRIANEFGYEFFRPLETDSVLAWQEKRVFVMPYAWLKVTRHIALRTALRLERRQIGWSNDQNRSFKLVNEYVVPSVLVRLALGGRFQYIIETGLESVYRNQEKRIQLQSGAVDVADKDIDDNRAIFSLEYAFTENRRIKIIEAFELDASDRGEFDIHDHGFLQLIFDF